VSENYSVTVFLDLVLSRDCVLDGLFRLGRLLNRFLKVDVLVGIIIFGNHEIYNFWLVGGASSLN